MQSITRLAIALSLLCLVGQACDAKVEPSEVCGDPNGPVHYADTIKPLMQVYCVTCHGAAASNRLGASGGLNFDTYADTTDNSSLARIDILSGRMPPGIVLTHDQRCSFDFWVRGGMAQ